MALNLDERKVRAKKKQYMERCQEGRHTYGQCLFKLEDALLNSHVERYKQISLDEDENWQSRNLIVWLYLSACRTKSCSLLK